MDNTEWVFLITIPEERLIYLLAIIENYKFLLSVLLITFIFILVLPFSVQARTEEKMEGEAYVLTAENITYDYENLKIFADRKVNFKYIDLGIKADKLVVDVEKEEVKASGEEVILISGETRIKGSSLQYNYGDRTGKFFEAESDMKELNFEGGVIEIFQDKDYSLEIAKARFTPCIMPEPHYHMRARSVKIYPDNKIIGNDIEFWWGEDKLFTLPAYMLVYEEINGDYEISHPFPLPEITYDSQSGISFFLSYPYQIGETVQGKVNSNYTQRGEQLFAIDNNIEVNQKVMVNNYFLYEKELKDEDKDYSPGEEEYHYTEKFINELIYQHNSFTFNSGFVYSKEEAEPEAPLQQKFRAGLKYRFSNFNINSQLDYNLKNKEREEKLSGNYQSGKYQLGFSQQYLNEEKNKEAYNIKYSHPYVTSNLRYRNGYDLDFYPYLTLNFPSYLNFKTSAGWGRVSEGEEKVNKKEMGLNFNKSIKPLSGFIFDFNLNLVYNWYKKEKEYTALVRNTSIGGTYSRSISDKFSVSSELRWENADNKGDFIISEDKANAESTLISRLSFNYLTSQPQSSWVIGGKGEYNLEQEKWDNYKLEVKRKFDCYSLTFNYDLINDIIGFGMNF